MLSVRRIKIDQHECMIDYLSLRLFIKIEVSEDDLRIVEITKLQ